MKSNLFHCCEGVRSQRLHREETTLPNVVGHFPQSPAMNRAGFAGGSTFSRCGASGKPGAVHSKETRVWLADQPEGRFTLVLTPKHGSWLSLVEGFFSKMTVDAAAHSGCVQSRT
jgi:hypothetical protein